MNTSQELFNQLRSKFSDLTMGNADAESTTDPTEAQFYSFEYKDHPVSVALGEKELSVYYSRSMTENQPMSDKTEWYEFIQEIRKFAKARNLGFDVRDISKSNLEKKDYKYLAQNKIAESRRMWGTTKTSYHPLQTAKVIIKHSKAVDEEQRGARSRNIKAIFIQNEEGERFKFPMVHLEGARAMARHVANGGLPYDDFGKYIQEQSMNLAKLRGFSRYINRNDLLNTSNDRIAEVTGQKIDNIKSTIHKLTTQKGYEVIKDSWKQTQAVEMTEEEIADYKDKLTKKTFDESMLEVLPIIHQAIKEADKDAMQQGDDETSSAQKNKAYVDTWLKGNNKLILKPNDAADNMLARTKFKDKNIMIASILRDIATRFLPQDDEAMRLNNFAADMDSEIQQQGELFVTPKKDYSQLKQTAIQLVKRYIDDLKQIKTNPKYKDAVRIDPQELKKYKNIKGQEVGKKDLGYKRKYKEEGAFESWADDVTKEYNEPKKKTNEGTWKAPQTPEDFRAITKLMKEPIPVGVDGDNAQGIMYDHIGDDSLFDDLYELSQRKGAEADARPVIKKYAEMFMRSAEMGVAKEGMLGFMAPGKNPRPTYKDKDDKVGVKTFDKPKGAKEPHFKKDKKTKEDGEQKEKMQVTKADKDLNTPAWKRYKAGDPRYEYKGTKEDEDDSGEVQVFRVDNIKYDTDMDASLPSELFVKVPKELLGSYEETEDFISNFISDKTGFTHKGFDTEPEIMDVLENKEKSKYPLEDTDNTGIPEAPKNSKKPFKHFSDIVDAIKETGDEKMKFQKRGDERYQYLQDFLKLEKKPNKTQADKDKMADLKRKMADLSA